MSEQWTYRNEGDGWLEYLGFVPTKEFAIDCAADSAEPGDWYEVGRAVLVTPEQLNIDPREFLGLKLARKIAESFEDKVDNLSLIDREQRFVENFGDRDLEMFLFENFREMIAAHLTTHPLYRIVDIERHVMESE